MRTAVFLEPKTSKATIHILRISLRRQPLQQLQLCGFINSKSIGNAANEHTWCTCSKEREHNILLLAFETSSSNRDCIWDHEGRPDPLEPPAYTEENCTRIHGETGYQRPYSKPKCSDKEYFFVAIHVSKPTGRQDECSHGQTVRGQIPGEFSIIRYPESISDNVQGCCFEQSAQSSRDIVPSNIPSACPTPAKAIIWAVQMVRIKAISCILDIRGAPGCFRFEMSDSEPSRPESPSLVAFSGD
jgi:hypothetical protein